MPNTGPRDGSRRASITRLPILASPSESATEVVVFPSPAGVGLMAVTSIELGLVGQGRIAARVDLGDIPFPYGETASKANPAFWAMVPIGCRLALRAISKSVIPVPPQAAKTFYQYTVSVPIVQAMRFRDKKRPPEPGRRVGSGVRRRYSSAASSLFSISSTAFTHSSNTLWYTLLRPRW